MTARTANDWIERLRLQPHPEGGFYRVTYTAATTIAEEALPEKFRGSRPASTAIYFLLSNQDNANVGGHFSAFHRLQSDEMWHFYAGRSLAVHIIAPDGRHTQLRIGPNAEEGDEFQAVVEAGCWFASVPLQPESYALVGCTVSPGFDFADFELAQRGELTAQFPQHAALIARYTRT